MVVCYLADNVYTKYHENCTSNKVIWLSLPVFKFWAKTRSNGPRSMIYFRYDIFKMRDLKSYDIYVKIVKRKLFSIGGLFGPIWGPYKNSSRVTTPHPHGNQCIYAIQQFYAKKNPCSRFFKVYPRFYQTISTLCKRSLA